MNIAAALLCTIASAALVACTAQMASDTGADPAIRIGESDLGGVVTSPNGPEAGVWVIAETAGLPTKYAKIVVTDERGRYVIPGTAEGELQRLGARLRAGRFAQGAAPSRASCSTSPRCRRRTKPRRRSTTRRSTGTRCSRSRRRSEFGGNSAHSEGAHADRLAEAGEEHRLHRLPPARPGVDAHDSRGVQVGELGRGVDAPPSGRPVRRADDDAARRQFRRGAVQVLRGVDRPHRQGRAAVRQAAAAAGRRAQRRRHLVGMEHARSTTCTT